MLAAMDTVGTGTSLSVGVSGSVQDGADGVHGGVPLTIRIIHTTRIIRIRTTLHNGLLNMLSRHHK